MRYWLVVYRANLKLAIAQMLRASYDELLAALASANV